VITPLDAREGQYVTIRDGALELGHVSSWDAVGRFFTPLADLRQRLACDTVLDMPTGPPSSRSGETGALALATHVEEAGDPAVAARWFAAEPTVESVRFVALEAQHEVAAKMLNDGVGAYLDAIRARAKSESWTVLQAFCRVETSTPKLVSVLCYGGGADADGATKTARGAITVRLGPTPTRVDAAAIFARRPAAAAKIARHCLGALVHKPAYPADEVLAALPRLTPAELGDFAVARSGVHFAVEYELAGQRRLMPCHVPHGVLGTTFEAFMPRP
jgi:hypothetical protein